MREFERQKIKESLANFLVVGAVFNRDGLGMRYAANRGYPAKKTAGCEHNPLSPTINLSLDLIGMMFHI